MLDVIQRKCNLMFNSSGINNPMNNFDFHVPRKYLDDEEFSWITKNLQANFYKLYSCASNFVSVQGAYYETTDTILHLSLDINSFTTNSIEYFLIKINTIVELCYQIYAKINEITNNKQKFEKIAEVLSSKAKLDASTPLLDWYFEVNEVRNRVIHGGYSFKVFEKNNKVFFQAYDKDHAEKILNDHGYFDDSTSYSLLIYVDKYMAFFIKKVFFFIKNFLEFTLREAHVSLDDAALDEFSLQLKNSGSCTVWHLKKNSILEDLVNLFV